MTTDALLKITFFAGFVPVLLFFIAYATMTNWPKTMIGRVVFVLALASTLSYGTSVLVLFFPEQLDATTPGIWIRIVLRAVFAVLFWGVLYLFVRYQRAARRKDDPE